MSTPYPPSRRRFLLIGVLIGVLAMSVAGCRGDGGEPASTPAERQDATAGLDIAAKRLDGPPPQAAASHILIAYTGSKSCPATVTRDREKARERAKRIAVRLRTDRGEFGPLARKYSDDPTARRNDGYIGAFWQGEMDALFEQTVFGLEVGEVGGPIETDYGFHVVRREPVQRVRTHHILVAWSGAAKAGTKVKRDHDEARRIAEGLRHRLTAAETDRCEFALHFSDDPHSRLECGDLGWLEPGLLAQEIDRVVFGLSPGQISPVVESDYGFHIFWRD